MEKTKFGGQAVVEGVMFQSGHDMVTAIRRNNDEREYFEMKRPQNNCVKKWKKIPVLRGNVAIIESSIFGMRHMEYATDRYERDPEDDVSIGSQTHSANMAKIVLSTVLVP